ncbi:hypothetical protein A4A58_26135 [Tardiphaga robiniae]|uniref:Haemolysin-type calcium binding-related domain-containing protein n=1 Tax=Tardiphaga robiniae TaxID=943830 RepID=A0A161R451_9BRAD|nr:hypothetical protein A4A58_26135 [Tardiphaga robiniae]
MILLLRFNGVAAEPEQISHQLGGAAVDAQEMVRCARALGLKARIVSKDWKRLLATSLPSNVDPSGTLRLSEDLAPEHLWFKQSGQDLLIEIMGSDDDVTVAGWFASPTNALGQIATAGGWTIDGQISQLVQAMATYSTSHAGFDTHTSGSQAPTDPALQVAIAAAWHQQAA